MSDVDLNPLLSEIAALRYEMRAQSYALLAASARNESSREEYIDHVYRNQADADSIGKRYRVIALREASAKHSPNNPCRCTGPSWIDHDPDCALWEKAEAPA